MVYDKFHVIQNVVEACDQVRKAESRADTGKRDRLERTQWMWLKNRVNWTEKESQKWESMALERCVTGMAYEMLMVLQGIYERKDAVEAKKLFRKWSAWVHAMRGQTGELLEPMARVARMVEGHLEGILAHWTRGLTTVFMEGPLSREAQSLRVPDGRKHDRHALLHRWETQPPVLLTH
jgi:transposase